MHIEPAMLAEHKIVCCERSVRAAGWARACFDERLTAFA